MRFSGTLGDDSTGGHRMMSRRGIKWLAGIGASLFLVFLALALALPQIIDSEAAKEKIRAFVSSQAQGVSP
jgi:hypothetical protein